MSLAKSCGVICRSLRLCYLCPNATTADLLASLRAHAEAMREKIDEIRAECDAKIAPYQRELDEAMEILGRASDEDDHATLTGACQSRSDMGMGQMRSSARTHISKSKTPRSDPGVAELADLANARGHSVRSLAAEIARKHPTFKRDGLGHSYFTLSQAARKAKDVRGKASIRRPVAMAARDIGGIPLDFWPRIVD